ncbi:MAG TPA: signal peptidase II [Kofleriaceae bacterium]|jgi:signal peptidase II|nr:signal peptidase II [Kofleriaceae bacterium]
MSDPAPTSDRKKWLVFLIVAVLSLVADQATKVWARRTLPVARADRSTVVCIVPDDMKATRLEGEDRDRPPQCHGEAVEVLGGFWDWRLSMNPGSAFGLFSSQNGARIGLSVVGVLAVFGMFWMLRKARPDQRILHWALALVAGGAVGNLIDRIYFGVVTDFILWHYKRHEWPVFNVADVVLVIGVGLMFIDIQKEGRREKARKAGRDDKAKAAGLVKEFGRK